MPNPIIQHAYAAFNTRNIDAALALMTPDVHWPKASEGGSVVGKDEIRAYWTRQWAEFNPHVDPIAISDEHNSQITVRVHQVVHSLTGDLLFDGEVIHIFTLRDGLIASMQLGDAANAASAFPHTA